MTPTFEDASHLTAGTSLVGKVFCDFDQLVEAFGQPHASAAAGDALDRVTVEWAIRTREGILTICDRSEWAGDGDTTITHRPIDWDLGGNAREHTDKAIHPVVALVHELTGCRVWDARPWCFRPAA
ncbi:MULTISPECIES: hypothetical protein [unclassified Synechococcus]|uniref:hypothetical protein n=1 Tax=unclassified Synechococcus TaxID=2626047 RepID=UPI001C222ECE|nr:MULTISPECIES: hypothetical protein [unclassified Synechococcus]